ncbi:unnamed protein product [Closterium sp. Naga37s-1]|nr:unnamed protein product [Closterium sp. Naga37s-1]
MRSRESKSRDNWSREFPLQAADAGREGLQSRKQGGAKAMIRSISDRVARDSVGPNATIPTSPASSTSSASSASSPKAIQGNASSRGRHPSRVAASDPLERTLPRKFRLNDDDTATTVRSEATDGEEDSDAGSVSMRQLRREIDDLRTQLERCVRINKLLSAERTANEATAAARVLASERDDVVKELEEVLKAWSQADDVAVAKQKEERATAQRTRVSLEWARAVLAQEREAVGREREELKQEREALQKDKERITKDAAKRAAQEVQGERSKLQQQAGMMGMQQQQHHVTPEVQLVTAAAAVLADFLASVEEAKQLNPVRAPQFQLVLYGLYKQATAGSITSCSEDDVDTDDQEKVQAWRDFAGLSIEVAMVNYVQKVKQFQMLFSPS